VRAAGSGELRRVACAGGDAVGQAELDRDPDGLRDLVPVDEAAQGDGRFLGWHGWCRSSASVIPVASALPEAPPADRPGANRRPRTCSASCDSVRWLPIGEAVTLTV
jgi:hypothetical protein